MGQELVKLERSAVLEQGHEDRTPALFTGHKKAGTRFWEFFTANIRNKNTRKAYYQAIAHFDAWCQTHSLTKLNRIQPIHIAAYIEQLTQERSKPTVKQHLAALRMLLDWLVTGGVLKSNPAHSVRGPKLVVRKGKTPVLSADEARQLLDRIDTSTVVGLRDRALIGLMIYTFARVGAVITMKVEDHYIQGRRAWVRLHEKGGKRQEMPCHHNLEAYLDEYIKAAGIEPDKSGPLFRTAKGKTGTLTIHPLSQPDVYRMIRRRAQEASIKTAIGCHTFRATGITAYLKNGGRLEVAQAMAGHESPRTTGLYDRRSDDISLDEVERIGI